MGTLRGLFQSFKKNFLVVTFWGLFQSFPIFAANIDCGYRKKNLFCL